MFFWSGKTYVFDILGTQRICENTFCLCYTFSLQFCYCKVFSPAGKFIDMLYLIVRSLRQHYVVLSIQFNIKQKLYIWFSWTKFEICFMVMQASAYEACDHTRTPLHTPKLLETCKKSTLCFIQKASRSAADRTSKTTTLFIFHFLYDTKILQEDHVYLFFILLVQWWKLHYIFVFSP